MENLNTEDDRQFWEATSVLYGETWSAVPKIAAVEIQTRSHLSNRLGKRRKLDCRLELSWSHLRQQGSNTWAEPGWRTQISGLSGDNSVPFARLKSIFYAPSPWKEHCRNSGTCTFMGTVEVASHWSLSHLLIHPISALPQQCRQGHITQLHCPGSLTQPPSRP